MMSSRIVQLLFLVSSMTAQVIGMMPQEASKIEAEGISSITPQTRKMGENLGMLLPELKHKIISFALELKLNPQYEVYKKLNVGSKVRGIALNANNTRALTGSDDGVARIWDVEKGAILKELKGHNACISSVALSADSTLALTGSLDGTVRVWNMNTGKLLKILQVGSSVYSVVLSADGALALISSFDRIARLYNASTGQLLKGLKGHNIRIPSVALSADGTSALTGSLDSTARVWDILTGESIILKVGSSVNSVALSANGAIALTAASNGKVLLWDAKWGILLKTLLPKSPYIHSVVLSKDGKRALVGTNDNTIQVWNTELLPGQNETSTPLRVLEGHTGRVMAVAFGGADFIASGSDDTTALIWKPKESVTLK